MAPDNRKNSRSDAIGTDGYPLEGRATASKIAKFLGVSSRTVYRLMEDGDLESFVMKGSVRGDWHDVRQYLAKSRRPRKAGA